jgi:hypothetical protein
VPSTVQISAAEPRITRYVERQIVLQAEAWRSAWVESRTIWAADATNDHAAPDPSRSVVADTDPAVEAALS